MESRIETLLKALLNGDTIEDFVPQSRSEAYLKNCILRSGVADLPAPQSRMDALLYILAEEIPGWSGGSDLQPQEKTVTPTTTSQSVTPDAGYRLTKVIVEAVTSAIDANIKAENIKEGISILGVAGTEKGYEAGKKSQYDEFWDNFLQNGKRTHYFGAFCGSGWNANNFKPKYDIKPSGSIENMFYYNLVDNYTGCISMKELEEQLGIVFDFSNVTVATRAFRNSIFKELNVIDFSKCKTITYAFASHNKSYSIERIEHLIFGVECVTYGGDPFNACSKMTHIGFEGTLDCNTLNLSCMPLLDKESLLAFINCLVDKSTDTSGTVWYVILGSTLLAKLTDDEKQIAINKGWELR